MLVLPSVVVTRLKNIGFPGQFQQKFIPFNSWLIQFRLKTNTPLNHSSTVKLSNSISLV